MKECGQEKIITLPIHGKERTFSKTQLIAILEDYFSDETDQQEKESKLIQVRTEGKWFEVNTENIDQSLFQEERQDENQEKTRKLILAAFDEINPYQRTFYMLIPEKYWSRGKTAYDLIQCAFECGGTMAGWIEQALEWAQRISNGASWASICNNPDTTKWYRMIIWEKYYCKVVGGSSVCNSNKPESDMRSSFDYRDSDDYDAVYFNDTVPLVVKYHD